MNETTWVRVRLENGHEASLPAEYAASLDLPVLDVPATNSRGLPLPASRKNGRRFKRKTTVQQEAAKKAATPQTASSPVNLDGVAVVTKPEEATA